jgi:tetratricopeptide (TPR) repeat protein
MPTNDASTWFDKGLELYNIGNYDESIKYYDQAIKINPEYAKAWLNKGNSLAMLDRYDEAILCYSRAVEIDQGSVKSETWVTIGNKLFNLRQYDKAITCFDNAIKINSRDQKAWRNKALTLYTSGKYYDALECYDRAIEIDPNYIEALQEKANTLADARITEEAIKYYDKVIEIEPNYATAWGNKGLALFDIRRYHESIDCYDKAIKIEPNYTGMWLYKPQALYKLGRAEEALDEYYKIIDKANSDIQQNPKSYISWAIKGKILKATGNFHEAETCFKKALELDNDNVESLFGLMEIYSDFTREYEKGLSICLKLLEIFPDNYIIKLNLAENYIKVGNYKEGRRLTEESLVETDDEVVKNISKYLIMVLGYLSDNRREASEIFSELVQYLMQINKNLDLDGIWNFNGLNEKIRTSSINLEIKFLLLTFSDLLKGEIDRKKLSFFYSVDV